MNSKPKPRVAVVVGRRKGGPLRWGTDLTASINRSDEMNAVLISTLGRLLLTPLFVPADIVHSVVPITLHAWRKPYLLTVKGDYQIEHPMWRAMYPRSIAQADAVTVPSDYLRRAVPALARATVIPNAVDLSVFPPPKPRSTDRKTVRAVMVTNFWFPSKVDGVRRVANALTEASRTSGVNAELTVVGGGKLLPQVQEALSSSVACRFTGWTDPKPILADADLFLYHSDHDNMPNVILEAMASGIPVLTNRVGAVGEMIESGRQGFIADNDEQYKKHLADLLTDASLRSRLGSGARARVEREFSWNVVVHRYLDLYQSIA